MILHQLQGAIRFMNRNSLISRGDISVVLQMNMEDMRAKLEEEDSIHQVDSPGNHL